MNVSQFSSQKDEIDDFGARQFKSVATIPDAIASKIVARQSRDPGMHG
jgi:hypothetical protein